MTSEEAVRATEAYEWIVRVQQSQRCRRDHTALYQVAKRLAESEAAEPHDRARAARTAQEVELLAAAHVDAIESSLGASDGSALEDAAWVTHLPMFLRDFDGLPAREALFERWRERLDAHRKASEEAAQQYYERQRDGDVAGAFRAGVLGMETAFLHHWATSAAVVERLRAWRREAGKHGLAPAMTDLFDAVVARWESAARKGNAVYARLNRSAAG